ncbi:hypothetical protein [Streptomyces qinglanensis]|uniref:Uncharacterized protein n=1 Tax=Streptomyces qinglanensis TaxID=943816 RepID=A0A1H9PRW8_9ACTN|nr:hypothetical protein [Streptomyces qinglanensis]SER50971.1 hypothetical protein SAMN05421870_102211 [Streptomyces qinglanensis]
MIGAAEVPPDSGGVVYPACLFVLGGILAFNIRGAADYVYLRVERRVTGLGGGIGPRTLRIAGGIFFVMGGIGTAVEVATRL